MYCTSAFARVLLAKWQNITTMATPIGPNVGEGFKAMWDTMI